jgi:beta-lactamase regulating signal transducer with metallopeptidase domain
MIVFAFNHLWQSTLVAGVVALLTLLFRNNGAHVRYALWYAASLKFLIPFSLFAMAGAAVAPAQLSMTAAALVARVQPAAEPFGDGVPGFEAAPVASVDLSGLFLVVWLAGIAAMLAWWLARYVQLRAIARAAAPLTASLAVPVRTSHALMEPGLVGIRNPILLLPHGIVEHLSAAEMEAILAHEMCHYRRRDNLTAAIHMMVEAIFWFYPLIWWIGGRLVAEREKACDEAVIAMGNDPDTYAEGILKVCKFYLRSPLDCAAGASGADLKKRIEAIMENRFVKSLDRTRKAVLAVVAVVMVGVPVAAGMLAPGTALAGISGTPSPGTEAALRHLIQGLERHHPDLTLLSPQYMLLPALVTPARLQRGVDSWGALKSIRFQGVNPDNEWDIYSIRFEKQLTVWQIAPLTTDGKIAGLIYDKAFVRSDRTRPSPGTEAALRHQLEGWLRHDPPMDNVTPEIAAIDREQQRFLQSTYFDQWGPIKSIRFTGVNANGLDVYDVRFAHGRGVFPVGPLAPDGKIVSWSITRAFDRSDDHPSPGTEASIRRYIAAMQRNMPNYDEMLPFVAEQVRIQLPSLLAQFQELGKLQAIKFDRINRNGLDVYDVTFAHGRTLWRIAPLAADGKVQVRTIMTVADRGNVSS